MSLMTHFDTNNEKHSMERNSVDCTFVVTNSNSWSVQIDGGYLTLIASSVEGTNKYHVGVKQIKIYLLKNKKAIKLGKR